MNKDAVRVLQDMTEEIQQIQPKAVTDLREQDWYIHFLEELQATVYEGEYNARWELLKTYHAVGKLITEHTENFNHAEVYSSRIYDIVAEDIKKSKSTVFKAVQFYQKYPNALTDVSSLPEGKNISWSKLVSKYLPEPKELPIPSNDNKDEVINNEPVLIKTDEKSNITSNVLDLINFSLRNTLDLFLEANRLSTDSLVLISTFAKHLLKKFTEEEIKQSINEYAKDKTDQEIKILNELVSELSNSVIPITQPLFENPISTIPDNKVAEIKQPTPVREFVSLYSELYFKKYNRKPLSNPKIYASLGKLLKTKLEQGFTFEEIKSLLQIYSKPANSDFCDFDPHAFFAPRVFNKLVVQMSKNSNQVLEGKYDKFEI